MIRKKEYPGFLLYFDRVEGLFNNLNDEQLGFIFRVMYEYSRYHREPDELPMVYALVWPTLKAMLDGDRDAYEQKCAQGAHAAACRVAEAKGKPKPQRDDFLTEYLKSNQKVEDKIKEQEFEALRAEKMRMILTNNN